LAWKNIHFQPAQGAQYGRFYNPFGKSKLVKRNISMTARAAALLQMRHENAEKPDSGWVFPADTKSGHVESLASQHRKAPRDCKVAPFVLYTLRHSMLSRLGEAGASPFSIQAIAGHSIITISSGTFTHHRS
jgi:integrase